MQFKRREGFDTLTKKKTMEYIVAECPLGRVVSDNSGIRISFFEIKSHEELEEFALLISDAWTQHEVMFKKIRESLTSGISNTPLAASENGRVSGR